MTFNIGNQQAGIINNVGRDQRISGGQQVLVSDDQAREAVRRLRDGIATTPLPEQAAVETVELVDDLDDDLAVAEPNRSSVAATLERLTRVLASAGSLATAGAVLLGPIQTLAAWLGTMGEPVLGLIGALAYAHGGDCGSLPQTPERAQHHLAVGGTPARRQGR